jgi:hypothetical protein
MVAFNTESMVNNVQSSLVIPRKEIPSREMPVGDGIPLW